MQNKFVQKWKEAFLCWGLSAFVVLKAMALGVGSDFSHFSQFPHLVVPPHVIDLEVHGAEKPIELRELRIQSNILGHLAETTVDMTFYNPNGRVLEGELQFPLLSGQTVTGFALEMENGEMREAVPVEKAKGRQAFEEVIRQKIDPALLEVTEGNNFKTRVYPLLPGQTRRVRMTYRERLPEILDQADSWGARPVTVIYRLPLSYADKVGALDLSVWIAKAGDAPEIRGNLPETPSLQAEKGLHKVTLRQKNLQLQNAMLELSIPLSLNESVYLGKRDGKTYFYTEALTGLSPMMEGHRVNPQALSILWDASASGRKRDHVKELAFLDAFFSEVQNVSVTLQKIRNVADPVEKFTVKNGNWAALRRALASETLVYDGATNLGAFDTSGASDMFFLFSDGLDNYSTTPLTPPASPLFTFISSSISSSGADVSRLKGLARSGGALIDLTLLDSKAALTELMKIPAEVLSIEGGVSDIVWHSPSFSDSTLAIAGIVKDPTQPLRVVLSGAGKRFEIDILSGFEDFSFFNDESESEKSYFHHVPFIWASMKLEKLEEEYDLNKGEIRRLGKAFGIATRETSLIVLERVEDYVRYDIEPPATLKKQYDSLRARTRKNLPATEPNKLNRVLDEWQEREKWWKKNFPKGKPTQKEPEPISVAFAPRDVDEYEAISLSAAPDDNASFKSFKSNANTIQKRDEPQITVVLRPLADAPYIQRMKEAQDEDLYRIYLDERPDYENSVAFYLDVAYQLRDRGQEALSLRVLSNLAEMDLENRQVLRVLGYRLLEAERPAEAVVIFKKVLALGEEEPQSYRDLGLAYAAAGERQKAIDRLYDVVEKDFARDFPGIEVIALTEMNAVIAGATGPASAGVGKLDLRRIDPRFLSNRPLDLRVVLTWDADNTDIDLHVIDPNEEDAFYGQPLSYQGGRVSPDNTMGYGPEEYSLKIAKPGKYRVEVNFFGHSQQILLDATTIQLDFFTHYGTKKQQKHAVTMRLKKAKDRIVVGEFEVK